MKVDYSKGKIYTIRSYSTDDVYVGSTCTTLTKRLSKHKSDYGYWLKKDYRYITSYEVLKHDDYYIELVEECPSENKQQLLRREGEVIRSMKCVNKLVAGRTHAEWNEDNAQRLAALRKEYYKKNKETIKAVVKEYRKKNEETLKAVRKQQYEKNREYELARRKKYRDENKARIAAHKAEKVTCGCGCVMRRDSRAKHEKTKKHQIYIDNLQRELDEEPSTGQGAQAAGEGNE